MPAFPEGIKPFPIVAPLTTGDSGDPSASVWSDLRRVVALIEDERHLIAHDLYSSVLQRVEKWEKKQKIGNEKPEKDVGKKRAQRGLTAAMAFAPRRRESVSSNATRDASSAGAAAEERDMKQTRQFLDSHKDIFETLEHRNRLFRSVKRNLEVESEWTLASTAFGVKTFYRREEDQSLSLKLEGVLEGVPLFEQVCVLKEVDLHCRWAPFCTSSMTLADFGKLDTIGWFMIGFPQFGLARDGCFRAIGCDNFSRDGSFLLAGQGVRDLMPGAPPPKDTYLVEDPRLELVPIPPIPSKRGSSRMTIRAFQAEVQILSPTLVRTHLLANVNPNLSFMPQVIVDFVMKHLAGVLLAKLQTTAKKIPKDPVGNPHAAKMRDEKEFYRWLMLKFEAVCKEKGWDMPRVTALDITDEELRHAERSFRSPRRAKTFSPASSNFGQSKSDSCIAAFQLPTENSNSATLLFHDSDSVSALSAKSSASQWWHNNPLGSYLREVEERTHQRKEAAVAEARRRAAKRLRPKALPSDKFQRLQELKIAKTLRQSDSSSSPIKIRGTDQDPLSASKVPWSEKFTDNLHSHRPLMRILVLLALFMALFSMLRPGRLLWLSPTTLDPRRGWVWQLLDDFTAVVYISICALPHYLLCDVALTYAFDSLELGSKSGRQVKRFYSSTIRLVVAASSLGIVGFSIGIALLKASVRHAIWSFYRTESTVSLLVSASTKTYLRRAGFWVPAVWQQWCSSIAGLLIKIVWCISNAVYWITSEAMALLAKSSSIGRLLQRLSLIGFAVLGQINEFVQGSVDGIDGKAELVPWRVEAFQNARTLFLHTAVFLVTTLVLFNVSARSARIKTLGRTEPRQELTGDREFNTKMSSISAGSNSHHTTNNNSRSYAVIPEDEIVENGATLDIAPLQPLNGGAIGNVDCESTTSSRKPRLRLRRPQNSSKAPTRATSSIVDGHGVHNGPKNASPLRKSNTC